MVEVWLLVPVPVPNTNTVQQKPQNSTHFSKLASCHSQILFSDARDDHEEGCRAGLPWCLWSKEEELAEMREEMKELKA